MITFTPAVLHFLIASGTFSLGGSIKDTSPKNSNEPSSNGKLSGSFKLNS